MLSQKQNFWWEFWMLSDRHSTGWTAEGEHGEELNQSQGGVKELGAFVECGVVLSLATRTWRVWLRCYRRKPGWDELVGDTNKFVPPYWPRVILISGSLPIFNYHSQVFPLESLILTIQVSFPEVCLEWKVHSETFLSSKSVSYITL